MADLVTNKDLTGFPGAPFPAGVLSAAGGQVRDQCGWHIAPSVTETVTLSGGGRVVLLPSLHVTGVESVTTDDGTVLEGWHFYPNGVLERTGCTVWPHRVTVAFTHGYESCPPSLFPVVAERARAVRGGAVKQESLAGRSVSLDVGSALATSADILSRFTLTGRP